MKFSKIIPTMWGIPVYCKCQKANQSNSQSVLLNSGNLEKLIFIKNEKGLKPVNELSD